MYQTNALTKENPMALKKNVRLTITMPATTYALLNEVAEKNKRSRLIAEAVLLYAQEIKKMDLRKRLIKGYQARAERDRKIAQEWLPLEEEAFLQTRGEKP
jgi:metal-responsive CopG/Arc/MetJ family transcriptional regulator